LTPRHAGFGRTAMNCTDAQQQLSALLDGELTEEDARALEIQEAELARIRKDIADQQRIMEEDTFARVEKMLLGKVADGGPNKLKAGSMWEAMKTVIKLVGMGFRSLECQEVSFRILRTTRLL